MAAQKGTAARSRVTDAQLQAVLAACQLLVGISARSIAEASGVVDLPQFRALVIVASLKSVSLGTLADAAGMSLSTASRMCDRLVGLGLLDRTADPTNRRQLVLSLTKEGQDVVRSVMQRRRAAISAALGRMSGPRRTELVKLLEEFAAAGGEPAVRDLWSLGWATSPAER